MIPNSPVAGLLTGLLDGTVVSAVVFLAVLLNNRRHHRTVVVPAEGRRPD